MGNYRLSVGLLNNIKDVVGLSLKKQIGEYLGIIASDVKIVKVYTITGLKDQEMQEVIDKAILHDPVLHRVSLEPLARDFDWIIEVGFRPGVTDNEGRVAKEAIKNGLFLHHRQDINVYFARQYLIAGNIQKQDVERIAKDLLCNELIEEYRIKNREEWRTSPGFSIRVPKVTGESTDKVEVIPVTSMQEQELLNLSRKRVLALSLDEMLTIKEYYLRKDVEEYRKSIGLSKDPTDVEIEALAQTWSEHCKHKIFNARIEYIEKHTNRTRTINSLFKTYIQKSTDVLRKRMGNEDFCLSVFKDNAGVIKLDDEYSLCIKVETHNSPSALDPYGGALTGIVGVNRDPMGTGLGANLLCNTDVFCFASPFYDRPLPPRLLHPRRVLEGVRKGVEDGGNQSGIPTVNGGLIFDERYLGKPLVFCGTVGIMPSHINGRPSHEKQAKAGDLAVMVGGRVGKDGIHGATFSSEALHEGSPATAVQIGDPITQRKMYDFLMKARDMGLYNAITDNGAGGLSSSMGEMAQDCGGCDIDLSKVPLKYDGLVPWEILLSEAQERMSVAVPKENIEKFLDMAAKMDVEATVLGEFNESGFFRVRYNDRIVAELDMGFFHNGVPQMKLKAIWEPKKQEVFRIPDRVASAPKEFLRRMLSRLNICSREYVIRQYDHEVQGGSVIKPLVGELLDGPSDAAVIRPVLTKDKGVVVSNGICPRFSDLDTYWMMAWAIDEAIRNAISVGANPYHMAGVDNFCWCDPVQSEKTPDGHYKLAQLVRANMALAHFCMGFGVPCISGKDSMKNDYVMGNIKISIPPTVLFSLISVIDDVSKCVSSDFKRSGDLIYILGITKDEMGRSEFASELGLDKGLVPQVDLLSARLRYRTLFLAIQNGLVSACHDISDGGLGVCLCEMCIGGDIGARIDVDEVPVALGDMEFEKVMYSETPSRFLVSVPKERREDFETLFKGQTIRCIGEVAGDKDVVFRFKGKDIITDRVSEIRHSWKKTLDF